jgi:hypothetical protein
MRKYEKYPLSPITGLIPQGDESGNVPQNVTPKTGRVKFEIRHPKFAMSMIPHSEFRIPHLTGTSHLSPAVAIANYQSLTPRLPTGAIAPTSSPSRREPLGRVG